MKHFFFLPSRTFIYPLIIFVFCGIQMQAQKKKKSAFLNLLKSIDNDSTTADYYGKPELRYEDYIYKGSIHTAQLAESTSELSQPLIELNGTAVLKLSFDDLAEEFTAYSYSFIHCNATWEPSGLLTPEYIEGFADNSINNYQFSVNTDQKYVHYTATFPSNSTRFLKSGNYLLKVYEDGNPENIVITKRFMVYENKLSITARVTPSSIIEDRRYKQEVDFTIDHTGYPIDNPYGDLKINLLQNNQWNTVKSNLKPVYVKDMQLVYDYDQENVFDGGNEFRNFDIKSLHYHSEHIADIQKDTFVQHVYLLADEKRAFKQYSSQKDINGKYVVKLEGNKDSEIQADYCYVTFFLSVQENLDSGNIYVYGAFNGWNFTHGNQMHYNAKRMGYECTLLFKQGYYNYEYVFLKDDQKQADISVIEGNHSVTENDYTILVYHRYRGTFYDQLISVKQVNSL